MAPRKWLVTFVLYKLIVEALQSKSAGAILPLQLQGATAATDVS